MPHNAARTPTHNLPPALTSFIGRARECDETKQLLVDHHLLTLTGAGGCGKTRLALRVATEQANDYADGVCWVDLASLNDAALVPQVVARALNVTVPAGTASVEAVLDFLSIKEILLVLDNCEHLLLACAELLQSVLRQAPDVHVLATSREPLAVTGEMLYPVSPLPVPPVDSVADIGQFDSIRLFVERARQMLYNFALSADNAPVIAEICRRVDGIPLAIELASARVQVLTVQQIAARLDDRFSLLTNSPRDSRTHHRTLHASIAWSFDLLSETEQILFRRLAVFAGSCTLEGVEAVCADGSLGRDRIAEALFSLVNKSLLVAETLSNGAASYHFLETIRQYAQEQLDTSGEAMLLRDRSLAHYVTVADETAPKLRGPYQTLWLGWLEREQDNFRSALEWSLESRQIIFAMRLTVALYEFWTARGYVTEGLGWSVRAWEHSDESVPVLLRANAATYISFLAAMMGNAPQAIDYGKQAVELCAEAGDDAKLILAMAYGGVSGGARSAADHVTAFDYGERALRVVSDLNNPFALGMTLISQGNNATALGRYATARQLLLQGLQMFERIGDSFRIALALNYLGDLERCEGNYLPARAYYESSLARMQELDSIREVAGILHNLAHTVLHQNEIMRAAELFKQSLRMHHAQGNQAGVAECLTGFAATAVQQNKLEQAARLIACSAHLGAKETSAIWAAERMEYEAARSAIRKHLLPAEWETAQREGESWSIEQAIEYALGLVQFEGKAAPKSASGLSTRELEIVMLVAEGKSNIEIADQLVLSKRTVEKHVANILAKLDFANRTQVARWAVENALPMSK